MGLPASYLPRFSVIVNSLLQLSYETVSPTPESHCKKETVRFLKISEDCGAVKQGALIYDSHRLLRGKGKIGGVSIKPAEFKKAAGR